MTSFGCTDGVNIPAPIRICMDIIETKAIESETIYRRSVNKTQLESLCDSINNDRIETRLDELSNEPNLACAIIKKFIRELKMPLVADDIIVIFDKCDANLSDKEFSTKIEYLKRIINRMAPPNRDTFTYLIMHFYRMIHRNEVNKLEVSLFVAKYQPYLRIKERLLKFIINYADVLFSDFRFKKYKYKANDETVSRMSFIPESIEDLELEISKKEAYLANLHKLIANEENDKKAQEKLSEELWALQRYVTSLKRKVKKLKQERKLLEAEQLNDAKIGQNQVTTSGSSSTIKNEEINDAKAETNVSVLNNNVTDLESNHLIENQDLFANPSELLIKDSYLICENNVLIDASK